MQQRLFFYILTCPHGNLTGLFVLKPGYASDDLKCLQKDFIKDLGKLIERALVSYDFEAGVILIHNFLRHNPITNPNQKKALVSQIKALPKTHLIQRFIELNQGLSEVLSQVLSQVLPKPDSGTDSEKDSETVPPIPPKGGLNGIPAFFEKQFWPAYPRKIGKPKALSALMSKAKRGQLPPHEQILSALEDQKTWDDWIKDEGKFIPHPTTWINREGWNDKKPEAKDQWKELRSGNW